MLSNVLNSETALWMKIEKIEQHLVKHDGEIKTAFAYLKYY